ncbi:MAG: glycosyltransferase [Chthoniobacteraceae bacterium]
MTFPRLLVATEFPPNASGGGPAVVRQMLEGWPAEKLFWWSVSSVAKTSFGRETAEHFVASVPLKLYPRVTLPRLKALLMLQAWAPFAARHLVRTIGKVQPDAIWIIPHLWSIPPLGRAIVRSFIPFHVSIHDLPDAHHLDRQVGRKTIKRMVDTTEDLYRWAMSRDAISAEMAAELEEKTGTATDQIIHAGLEPEDFAHLEQRTTVVGGKIKIAYAGTIVAEKAFLLFVEALHRIRSRLPRPLELHFFGAHSYREMPWFRSEWMTAHGDLPAFGLKNALRDFDWGFAPMELDDSNTRYNHFSLPTKVVSYLAAGLGIISLGHSASTIAQLAQRYNFGLAITETSLPRIEETLMQGLGCARVWERYGAEIIDCAHAEFDAAQMRRGFLARLRVATG